uniref:CSON003085 protein n=1 Tax=Culicoides sonorensis TaxID=179676 RepID=A0A336ML22_CULSO
MGSISVLGGHRTCWSTISNYRLNHKYIFRKSTIW